MTAGTLDILILIALALGVFRGFGTGAVRQIAGAVGLVLAFIIAMNTMEPVGGLAAESLGLSARVAPLVGFVIVFLVVQIAVFAVVRVVEKILGALKLTLLNRLLGGVAGAFKAALVVSVLFLVLGRFGIPDVQAQQESQLYGPVALVLPTAWDYAAERLPDVQRVSEKFGQTVRDALPSEGI